MSLLTNATPITLHACVLTPIAAICGADLATSDRYEARNDALRSIMRDRHLPPGYFAAILAQLSRSVEVRLKTGAPGVESTGSGKK